MFCFKVTDAAVEQAKMLLTSTGPEPRTCLKQPISASDSPLPSELQIKESVEVWNNTRETNLRYKHQFPTLFFRGMAQPPTSIVFEWIIKDRLMDCFAAPNWISDLSASK